MFSIIFAQKSEDMLGVYQRMRPERKSKRVLLLFIVYVFPAFSRWLSPYCIFIEDIREFCVKYINQHYAEATIIADDAGGSAGAMSFPV
ncbi:MAG: hypothetical protein K6F48_11445 [Paludibacteraceae bacterium]|nr:hypothetical protein [Paludibacteraceae bacterium]